MEPFSLFGKTIPVWIPASVLAIGIIGAAVYAASKAEDWRKDWLEKQPLDVRLAMNDKSLLCSNDYYSTNFVSFKFDDEVTLEMILEEKTEILAELEVWEEKQANYLSLDTSDWTEKELKDRPEAIKHYEKEIKDLKKKLKQLEEKLKQLEDEVHIESYESNSYTPSSRVGSIDTSRFISNALGSENYSRDTLITFDKESWLKFQVAVYWEFLSSAGKEKYFARYGNFRPAYSYSTPSHMELISFDISANIRYPLDLHHLPYTDSSYIPYFDPLLSDMVSESKYGSMYIKKEDMYYVEVPGNYNDPNYKAIDTLGSNEENSSESSKGMQCIEFLREIPPPYEDDISFIKEFPELKYLSIGNPKHTKYLRYTGKLLALTIGRNCTRDLSFFDRDFDGMANPHLVDLKYLHMNLDGISDLKHIQNRKKLEYLILEIGRYEHLAAIGPSGRGLINKVGYSDEKGVAGSQMAKKSIAGILGGLNWPNLKYLGIKGAITSDFVWMTQFDNLEMLDLNITYSSYCRTIKTDNSEDSQSSTRKSEPYYQATQLIPFKDKELKELGIRARGLDESDCDMLKRTLENANVYCSPRGFSY